MTGRAIRVISIGLAAVSMKFAGVAVAASQTSGDTFHGPSSTIPVVSTIPNAGPAVINAPAMGSDAASADAKGSLGNSSPVSGVCQQNASGSDLADGATVNTGGSESAYNRSATDGKVTASMSAVPQYKAQQMAIAIA